MTAGKLYKTGKKQEPRTTPRTGRISDGIHHNYYPMQDGKDMHGSPLENQEESE
jgi:hypothetical protein